MLEEYVTDSSDAARWIGLLRSLSSKQQGQVFEEIRNPPFPERPEEERRRGFAALFAAVLGLPIEYVIEMV